MRLRHLLPLVGLLALGACKDEKKPEPANPPATTTPAPGAPTTPAPATKPPGQ